MPIRADELLVDHFAGGGGASTGIFMATGRHPDLAVNHDPEAIAMHAANHPTTRHFLESVWDVDPVEACGGRPVGLAWFSPDCKHFSKAKGGKPVDKKIRGLAWIVTRWARAVKPRVIILENVEEFATWGPLLPNGLPDPRRAGFTFRRWCAQLRNLGYEIEMRELRACDYGAPTIRKRLFVIARCDGQPIRWPEPTHGPGRLPYRTAAECIDWSIPVPSIFGRSRPLAENTLRRIARGIQRFVIDSPRPFIVPLRGTSESHTSVHSVDAPLSTVSAGGTHHGLVAAFIANTRNGEREGQAPRVRPLDEPAPTVTAQGSQGALVAAFLAKHYGGVVGSDLRDSIGTVTARDHHSLVTAQLALPLNERRDHSDDVRAFLVKFYGNEREGHSLQLPLGTVTTRDRFGLVTVAGQDYRIVDIGMRMLAPHELFAAQGFPADYRIELDVEGRPITKTAQIRLVGNSVCPPIAAALVRANVGVDSEVRRAA